jgi:hypothetical protein
MDSLESNFSKLGKYLVGGLLIWLGLVGLLDVGFTTISTLPLVEFEYLVQTIYVAQILLGLAVFNRSLRRFAKPVAMLYFLVLTYNFYISLAVVFDPALPYLSDLGRNIWLEVLLIFSGYGYLKRVY